MVKWMFKFTVKLNLREDCWVLISRKDELVSPTPFFNKMAWEEGRPTNA